jgi:multiple antibiotic resistance protein
MKFWLVFVPLFIAVDAIGVLPLFMSLTEGLSKVQIRKIIIQSALTAFAVSFLFLAIGQFVLKLLGITVPDFMVSGGILLFAIALSDMLRYDKRELLVDPESLGAVPLGIPLIVGPAFLTTTILLLNQYGLKATSVSIALNIALAAVIFFMSGIIHKLLGKAGSKTVSKLASLLLAAIAVMMVRKGIYSFFVH